MQCECSNCGRFRIECRANAQHIFATTNLTVDKYIYIYIEFSYHWIRKLSRFTIQSIICRYLRMFMYTYLLLMWPFVHYPIPMCMCVIVSVVHEWISGFWFRINLGYKWQINTRFYWKLFSITTLSKENHKIQWTWTVENETLRKSLVEFYLSLFFTSQYCHSHIVDIVAKVFFR